MHDKIQVIMDLMKELQGEMEPKAEDLEERLGRKKPDIAIAKIDLPMHAEEGDGKEEDVDDDDMSMQMPMEEESPEEKLKNRIMKMRG